LRRLLARAERPRFGSDRCSPEGGGVDMLRDQLSELLRPVVHSLGYELWELEYAPRAGGGLLRVYIDSPNGISLDDCARVSHAVSDELDATDPIPGHYTLEVSSPGLDRVLRTSAQFARFQGERIKLEMSQPVDGRRRFLGRLLVVSEAEIVLEADGREVHLPIAGIHKARLEPAA
jgi:ribosome maturation factor RimP